MANRVKTALHFSIRKEGAHDKMTLLLFLFAGQNFDEDVLDLMEVNQLSGEKSKRVVDI